MKWLLLIIMVCCSNCTEHEKCQVVFISQYSEKICTNVRCYYETFGPQQIATCRDFYQMHATSNLCSYRCNLKFSGKIDTLRTNSFTKVDKLEQVFLNATSIRIIQGRAFSGSSQIKSINLSRNLITRIPENTFSRLKNLTVLDLSYNKIDEIEKESFKECTSLNTIDFSHNNIQNLSTKLFESMIQLKTVNLSDNALEFIDENWCLHFHSLKIFILDNNKITNFPNCTFNFNIEILSVSGNRLRIINDRLFPENLKILNLSNNIIETIEKKPFKHLSSLQMLDLSRNKIKRLPFDLFGNMKNLTKLDISENDFLTIYEGVFHGLINLKYINLRKIGTFVESRIFYSIKNITQIDISENNLLHFNMKSLLEFCPKLNYLVINKNSFSCSELSRILLLADARNITIPYGFSYEKRNLNGIECFEEKYVDKSNDLMDSFGNSLKKEILSKLHPTSDEPIQNDIRKLVEMEKYLVQNFSKEISIYERKILSEILSEMKNAKQFENTEELFEKLIANIESMRIKPETNLTSEMFAILQEHNQALLTTDDPKMANLLSLLMDLKFLLSICTIILISFCIVKLFERYGKKLSKLKSDNRELTLMERQEI